MTGHETLEDTDESLLPRECGGEDATQDNLGKEDDGREDKEEGRRNMPPPPPSACMYRFSQGVLHPLLERDGTLSQLWLTFTL